MNKILYSLIIISSLVLFACGNGKKKSMKGEDKIDMEEFLAVFPVAHLPYSFTDSLLPGAENDTALISPGIYHQFVPDTVTKSIFPATVNAKSQFYPVAKINGDNEIYLISKGVEGSKKAMFLTAYDSKTFQYISGMVLLKNATDHMTKQSITIDDKYNIVKDVAKTLPNDVVITGHDVYVLNNQAKRFMLVMVDSLGSGTPELINPIDTLGKKQRYSADYGDSKKAFVSIRDGKREGRFNFFIYIKNLQKDCSGELKGEATFISPTTAEYRQGGDPCVLQFIFSKNAVSLKEVEGCGSRLGNLQCKFDGIYPKQKVKTDLK